MRSKPKKPILEYDRVKLMELRRLLTFERSDFSVIGPRDEDALPRTEAEVNAFIRERTRLWRESWVFPIIDEMLARGRGEDS